jgi:hypothetical protein
VWQWGQKYFPMETREPDHHATHQVRDIYGSCPQQSDRATPSSASAINESDAEPSWP